MNDDNVIRKGDLCQVIVPPKPWPEGVQLSDIHKGFLGTIGRAVKASKHPYSGAMGWTLEHTGKRAFTLDSLRKIKNPGDDETDERDLKIDEWAES